MDEWLWGWDPTPGIVSVWADEDGHATVWRRLPQGGGLVREETGFRPWLLYDRLDDVQAAGDTITIRELAGPGALRYHLSADRWSTLTGALIRGASRRLGRPVNHVRDLPEESLLVLPPDEQYLVATGRTYFRDLVYDDLRRMQFDLETTSLEPARGRIFMIGVRDPDGVCQVLEADGRLDDARESDLIRRLVAVVQAADPDVIENHNLHGFDLPFLDHRARRLRVPLALGRIAAPGLRQRGARRGAPSGRDDGRRVRFVAPGRELIDTLDAVRRHDFSARDLPGHGLKAVARHFGISGPERELIPGPRIHHVYQTDPERVRRYATADVEEVAALSRLIGGAAFALEQSPGWRALALDVDVGEGIAQDAHRDFDTQPAAKFSGAAAAFTQALTLDQYRIINLLQFHRRILHVALAHRHGGILAVFVRASAPTTAHDRLA